MSVRVQAQVWDSELPKDEKYLLVSLADWADDDGYNVYPSVDRLVWKTGYSEREVRRTLKSLREKKILVLQSTTDWGTNNYKIEADALPQRPPFQARKRGRVEKIGVMAAPLNQMGATTPEMGATTPEMGAKISGGSVSDPLEIRESGAFAPDGAEEPDPTLFEDLQGEGGRNSPEENKNGGGGNGNGSLVKNPGAAAALVRGLAQNEDDILRGIDLAEWPEDVRPVVRAFCRMWGFKTPTLKKKKGYWITSARELKATCGEFGSDALKEARQRFEDYMETHHGAPPFDVKDIGSVIWYVQSTVGLMRTRQARREIPHHVR